MGNPWTGVSYAETSGQERKRLGLERPAAHQVNLYQSRLFPVSQAFQLLYDFDQPLKPPVIVGCCGAVFRANQIFAIRVSEFSYCAPPLFDALRENRVSVILSELSWPSLFAAAC